MKNNCMLHTQKIKMIFLFAAIALLLIQCSQENEKKSSSLQPINSDPKFVYIPETNIPDGPGADIFKTNCLTCHSARYVEMQPDFPGKTWDKIVDKMVKNYGAPISDSTAKSIANYLATVKEER